MINQITHPIISMTSREIAELTGKNHKDVMRDIRALADQLQGANLRPACKSTTYEGSNGQSYPQYELDKDTCLTLLLGYDAVARMKVVKRWQELEGRTALPQNLPDALRLAADQAERAAKAESALALAAPKVQALDLIAADDKSLTVTQAAKVLGIKRDNLTNWLNANGWIYRQNGSWVAYQQHIQNGRLIYKEARYTDDLTGQETYRPYCHITSKGLVVLAEEFGGQELAA